MLRIGAPAYRLQLEASRMRLRFKAKHHGMLEYFVNQETFPDSSFEPFTRGDRQMLLLNIIESNNVD